MILKKLKDIKYIIVVLFLAYSAHTAIGQTIYSPYLCDPVNMLPVGCAGTYYEITFEHDGNSATNWSVVYPEASRVLELDMNTFTGVLSGDLPSDDGSVANGDFDIIISATIDGSLRTQTFRLPFRNSNCPNGVQPCLLDIAFLLDKSGSMNGLANPTNPALGTKWEVLADAINTHIATIYSALSPNHISGRDSVSFTLFYGNQTDIISQSTINPIPPDLSAFQPSGATPMGGGIQRILMDIYNSMGEKGHRKKRVIILLTDGRQNINPIIQNNRTIITDSNYGTNILGNGTGNGTLPINFNNFPANEIKILALGVGAGIGTSEGNLLKNFVGLNGEYQSTLDMATTITEFFNGTIPEAVDFSTPRILDIRRKINSNLNSEKVEFFSVNDSVASLTFQIINIDKKFIKPEITVYKDGIALDVNPVATTDKLVLYDFDFPTKNIGLKNPNSSRGKWEIRFKNSNLSHYQITAFVEESNIHTNLIVPGNKNFFVGDNLPIEVKVSNATKPITDAKVTAYVLRPGEDLGNLVSEITTPTISLPISTNPQTGPFVVVGENLSETYNGSIKKNESKVVDYELIRSEATRFFSTRALEQGITLGQAKIDYAVSQPEIWKKLQRVASNKITLTHVGNGIYKGKFTGNEITGNYRIISRIEGTHPTLGNYEGRVTDAAFFDFGRPEDINLNEAFVNLGTIEGQQAYLVRITPTNKFNKKLGPAQLSRIWANKKGAKVSEIKDNLDGSYEFIVIAPKENNNPIDVFVIDSNKAVASIQPSRKFGLSFFGGLVQSENNVNPLTIDSEGYYGDIGLNYQIGSNLALQAVGTYMQLDDDFKILGGTLFGQFSIRNNNRNGINAFAALGGGIYKGDNEDSTIGRAVKGGIIWKFNTNAELSAEYGRYWLNDTKRQLSFFGAGLRFYIAN